MASDIENWMKHCNQCLVAKAPYAGIKVKQGTIIPKNPMELVCVEALTVAKALVDKWFIPYGVPARLHSDKGKSFENEIITHLCKIYGIQKSTTTPYNPRGNGICERFNRTLHGLLKTLNAEEKHHWPKHINHINHQTSLQSFNHTS